MVSGRGTKVLLTVCASSYVLWMPDGPPRPDLQVEVEGRLVQLRASQMIVGVWDAFDKGTLLGTIAESHSFHKESAPKYVARRDGSTARELVDGLHAGVRFLVGF